MNKTESIMQDMINICLNFTYPANLSLFPCVTRSILDFNIDYFDLCSRCVYGDIKKRIRSQGVERIICYCSHDDFFKLNKNYSPIFCEGFKIKE